MHTRQMIIFVFEDLFLVNTYYKCFLPWMWLWIHVNEQMYMSFFFLSLSICLHTLLSIVLLVDIFLHYFNFLELFNRIQFKPSGFPSKYFVNCLFSWLYRMYIDRCVLVTCEWLSICLQKTKQTISICL